MAAGGVIGSLRVNLGLDSAKFERGAKRVNDPLKKMRSQFLAVAGVAAAMGAAISTAALKGAQEIDKSAKAARRLGSSIGGFRALELAADEAGVSLSSLTNDVQTIDREIASIGKSGNAERALDALGLSIDDLAGKDADEKLATIADRVKALGLTTGETTSILRDLGVRNREMVLLVGQGGDALRQARQDIVDYGLAISQVDSERIEQANDRISRLGLIGQYAGQQLAQAIVPTLGHMAEAMTDSLRAGGALRGMIDGLVDNLGRLASYLTVAVAGFGVRFVGALVLAKIATFSLAGALTFLKAALIRTGIGALIVAAGELVFWFGKLVKGAGGFGNAIGLLKAVAVEVFGRIKDAFGLVPLAIKAGSDAMVLWFMGGIQRMYNAFASFTQKVANGLNDLFGTNLKGAANSNPKTDPDVFAIYREMEDRADASAAAVSAAVGKLRAPLKSLKAIRDALSEVDDGAGDTTSSIEKMNEALDQTGGGGAGAVQKLKGATESLKDKMADFKATAKDAFVGFVTGAKSAKEAVADLLASFANKLAGRAFDILFGAIFPSAKGNVFSHGAAVKAFAKGGVVNGPTTFPMPGNQIGLMGEAGPEAIMPLRRGANGKLGVEAATSNSNIGVTVTMDPSTAMLGAFVTDTSGRMIAEATPQIVGSAVGATYERAKEHPIPGTRG